MSRDMETPPSFSLPTSVNLVAENCEWSTQRLAAGVPWSRTTFCLFTSAIGWATSGYERPLGVAETSLQSVPPTHARVVTRVSWHVSGGSPQERAAVINNGVWSWCFGTTLVEGGPLQQYDLPERFDGRPEDEVAEIKEMLRDRQDMASGQVCYREVPVHLPMGSSWELGLQLGQVPVFTTDVFVRFCLHGAMSQALAI